MDKIHYLTFGIKNVECEVFLIKFYINNKYLKEVVLFIK